MIIVICFNCGLKLHNSDEKECRFCGVRFSSKCTSCGFPNPTAARFCVNCGLRLSKKEGQSSVENYATLSEGRKNVAVIFADVAGFTRLSEKMDPEEVREIINECFNYITSPVYELGGTIDKYIGDCVMILFGARYTHMDDTRRAVMCALKMMELIADFSQNNLAAKGLSLNLSIGVNYGLVVTGGVGNYFDRDYTVMGDIVNTAQRLQTCAADGEILVSESIYSGTSTWFDYSEASEVKVRNREMPVKCYKPLKINTDYHYDEEQSFVGRKKEMALLNTIYNNSMNSGFQTVTVIGEAGVGKTRFLKEFMAKLENDTKKIWVDCGTDFVNRPYSMVVGILSSIMNINPLDSISMRQHRLISFLDYILGSYSDEEIKRSYNFIGLLMGLDRDNDFQSILQSMNFDNVRREIIKQLTTFFKSLCEKQKLVIVVDDLQWVDYNSLELINDLVPGLKETKAVLIFSSRSERLLVSIGNGQLIKLDSFSAPESAGLACSLLECELLDDELLETVLKLSSGNPLYINEFISSLKRRKGFHINKGVASIDNKDAGVTPTNLRNLILSGLSSVDAMDMSILQAASVIGKEFSLGMVAHLLDYTADEDEIAGVALRLGTLQLKKVHTSARAIEKVYYFVHETEREVIYDGILNKNKKLLHKKAGEYIEARYSKELESYYELLGEHYQRADILKKSVDYNYLSALKHKEAYNFESAIAYFNRYLSICLDSKMSGEEERNMIAYRELGYINFVTASYDSALECLEKALIYSVMQDDIFAIKLLVAEIYKDKGLLEAAGEIISDLEPKIREDSSSYGQWLQLKCNILRIQGDPAAYNLVRKSEKALLRAGDFRSLSETMKHVSIIHFSKGDIKEAMDFMKKSFKYAEKLKSLDLMANVSGDLGIICYSTGRLTEAQEYFNKSMELSKRISFQKGITAACINLGILYLDKGFFKKACKLFEESLTISVEVGSRLYECISLINLGDIAYEEGDFKKAEEFFTKSLELAKNVNAPVEEGINLLGLTKVFLKTTRQAEIPGLLEQAFKLLSDADEILYIADYHVYMGIMEKLNFNYLLALKHFENAEQAAQECKNDRRRLKAIRHKSEILVTMGRCSEALELINKAVEIAGRVESDYDVAKCYYRLSKVQKECGMPEAAEISLDKAAEHIKEVDECRWTGLILAASVRNIPS